MKIVSFFSLCMLVLCFSCGNDDDNTSVVIPDQIVISEQGLYPEGMVYDPQRQVFYVSSVAKGKISTVALDGTITTFADAPDLISTLGMELDSANNRLLVCVTDPGFNTDRSTEATVTQVAALAMYDLNTGDRISYTQISTGAPHLANDLISDTEGNVYITDSFSPTIYKVDASGTPSIFFSNEAFAVTPGNFGLNGIAFHPDGFLIVSKYDEGKLFKVPVNNPSAFQEIMVTNGSIPTIDGVLLVENNTLAVSSNNLGNAPHPNTLFQLQSSDNWETATIESTVATGERTFPTTFTKVGSELYIQYARLQALAGGITPAFSDFPIVKVNF